MYFKTIHKINRSHLSFSHGEGLGVEETVNQELIKVKSWCDTNKLSLNLSKTNFMIIKPDNDGNTITLEQRDNIKYLGVIIDEKLNWKYHISFVCSGIA